MRQNLGLINRRKHSSDPEARTVAARRLLIHSRVCGTMQTPLNVTDSLSASKGGARHQSCESNRSEKYVHLSPFVSR